MAPAADALEARARVLRKEVDRQVHEEQTKILKGVDDARRGAAAAQARATEADRQLKAQTEHLTDVQKESRSLKLQAAEADASGRSLEAIELREHADGMVALAKGIEDRIAVDRTALAAARKEATDLTAKGDALVKEKDALLQRLGQAEASVDAMEDKARYLREADAHEGNAARLRQEADQLRASGKSEDADRTVADAVSEAIAADAKRGSAHEQVIDESAIKAAGLGDAAPSGARMPGAPMPDSASLLQDDFDAFGSGSPDPSRGGSAVAAADGLDAGVDPLGNDQVSDASSGGADDRASLVSADDATTVATDDTTLLEPSTDGGGLGLAAEPDAATAVFDDPTQVAGAFDDGGERAFDETAAGGELDTGAPGADSIDA